MSVHKMIDGGLIFRWTACGLIVRKSTEYDRTWRTVTCERCMRKAPKA